MPVFHFVLHAYGSWHPDHPAGWHQHGIGRPLRPNQAIATYRRSVQQFDEISFDYNAQNALVAMAIDACAQRSWRCHAAAANYSHVHLVASWFAGPLPDEAQSALKRLLGWRAAKVHGIKGRKWFSHGGRPEPVLNADHLNHLVHQYLRDQGGVYWKEGDPLPQWEVP